MHITAEIEFGVQAKLCRNVQMDRYPLRKGDRGVQPRTQEVKPLGTSLKIER